MQPSDASLPPRFVHKFRCSSESEKPPRREHGAMHNQTNNITKDSRTMRRLVVLTYFAFLLSSASASSRNGFISAEFRSKAAGKPTLVHPVGSVGGSSRRCSHATSAATRRSQIVALNQQHQFLVSLRAGYQEQQIWQADAVSVDEEEQVEDDEEEDEEEEEDSYSSSSACHPPSIALDEMAMALRWTGELNRRMMIASASTKTAAKDETSSSLMSLLPPSYSSSLLVDVRGGERAMPVEQQQQQQRQLSDNDDVSSLTIFHAKTLFQGNQEENPRRQGAFRWGPDLESYLEHLVDDVFELKDTETRSLALSLAMMYMDRATSVDTPRQEYSASPSCPYCSPRTVHRLILTSLYLAVQAILQQKLAMSGNPIEEEQPPLVLPSHGRCLFYETKLKSLGIASQEEMHHMIEWMKTALGDEGFFVTSNRMRDWRRTWERSWFTATTTTTTPTMSIKTTHGKVQQEVAPEVEQEQPPETVPRHASFLPETSTSRDQQQQQQQQCYYPVNHPYDYYRAPMIPPPPTPRRARAGGL
jgi:hypothetical protein